MRRPRRLFRSSKIGTRRDRVRLRPVILAGLLIAAAGAATVLAGLQGGLFGRVAAPSGTLSADAPFVAVVDGDTLRLHETVVSLLGVRSPRRGMICQDATGSDYDCGRESAAALGNLVHGQSIACRLDGRDPAGRARGDCEAGNTQLGRALILAGWARAAASERAEDLRGEEQQARAARRGIWRGRTEPSF